MHRTLEQNKILHKLIGELRIDTEMKANLIYQFTDGRESSSAEMSVDECGSLISYLQGIFNQGKNRENTIINKLRWRFFYTLRDKGYLPDLKNDDAMDSLDAMTLKIWHKSASQMNAKDLTSHIGIVKRWKNKKPCQK